MKNSMSPAQKEKLISDLIKEHHIVVGRELDKSNQKDRSLVIPESVHDYTEMFLEKVADIAKNL